MHKSVDKLISIQNEIQEKSIQLNYHNYQPNIVAVSKTFPLTQVMPLINHGHIHFGENKVQEAIEKWLDIKNNFENIKLHMVGKLQTNKVKHVIPLFDYIHSLDNLRLAEKIANEQLQKNKKRFRKCNFSTFNKKLSTNCRMYSSKKKRFFNTS